MPRRILHISTRLILGGSQENTVLSCEGQADLGHDVHLAFGPIYGPEGSMLDRVNTFRTTDNRPITTHEVPALVREVKPGTDWACYKQLRALIRELQPDIVHTHSSKAGVLGRWAAWEELRNTDKQIGVVHTIHGPPFHRFQSSLKNIIYVAAERFAARRCHEIVSVADAMTRQYLAAGIGRASMYTTVRSGMETETYLNAKPGEDRASMRTGLNLTDSDFVVGTVARLAEHKGHDDLLDALGEHLKANPHWKLLWVGDGWWKDRLMARVRELGLESQIITTGLVPPKRVPACIRAMDVLCHPSYREGLPRTVPQALLCAVPVVAHDVDGTREACLDPESDPNIPQDRATGRLVKPGDHEGLHSALLWMHDHPQERTIMAERGRAWCASAFSAAKMVEDLERVYDKALGVRL